MSEMEPLIVSSNDPMVGSDVSDVEANIEAGVQAAEAGAAILHHHLIFKQPGPGQIREFDVKKSVAVIQGIRRRSNAIFQFGMTSATPESRFAVALAEPVDMFSITLGDNDNHKSKHPTMFRDREDMVRHAKFCKENGIIPEWEILHSGSVWNLNYLLKQGLVHLPPFINLTMYGEGSSWSPRTFDEIDHRSRMLPEGCKWHLAVMSRNVEDPMVPPITPEEHTRLLAYAILRGGHVRTGKEDVPPPLHGQPAKTHAEMIRDIIDLARRLGRRIATPDDARRILKISEKRR